MKSTEKAAAQFKGKHIGVKGFVRESDDTVCLIYLSYDKKYRDKSMDHAYYSKVCRVEKIENCETGEVLPIVHGYCTYKCFPYITGHLIFKEIYFFPLEYKHLAIRFASHMKKNKRRGYDASIG